MPQINAKIIIRQITSIITISMVIVLMAKCGGNPSEGEEIGIAKTPSTDRIRSKISELESKPWDRKKYVGIDLTINNYSDKNWIDEGSKRKLVELLNRKYIIVLRDTITHYCATQYDVKSIQELENELSGLPNELYLSDELKKDQQWIRNYKESISAIASATKFAKEEQYAETANKQYLDRLANIKSYSVINSNKRIMEECNTTLTAMAKLSILALNFGMCERKMTNTPKPKFNDALCTETVREYCQCSKIENNYYRQKCDSLSRL